MVLAGTQISPPHPPGKRAILVTYYSALDRETQLALTLGTQYHLRHAVDVDKFCRRFHVYPFCELKVNEENAVKVFHKGMTFFTIAQTLFDRLFRRLP